MSDAKESRLPAVREISAETQALDRPRPYEDNGIVFFKSRIFERCSIKETKEKNFKNAEMKNVSGKKGAFTGIDFRYAELQDCYFHGAHFENCNFTGAKIRRCNFRTATFTSCIFDYITIEETPIDYKQVVKQLPSRPNVAQEILQALRRNSVTLGEARETRELTLLEVEQEREHLKRARKGQEAYYSEKYSSLPAQAKVRFRSLTLWVSSLVWGHGERLSSLIISCFICVGFLSLLSVSLETYQRPSTPTVETVKSALAYFKSNSLEVLGLSSGATQTQPLFIQIALAILKIVFGGMFVAYIFRAISRR